jgi:hypothetical protein
VIGFRSFRFFVSVRQKNKETDRSAPCSFTRNGDPYKRKEVKKIMNIKTRFTTAIATGAVLLNALAPVALAQTMNLEISGNGADSDSTANVTTTNNTTVSQTNVANIENDVVVDADTGHNDANSNTGGDVSIETGDATTDVAVANAVNANSATVDNCCVTGGDVKISGNGEGSDNRVNLTLGNNVALTQYNVANVNNDVDVESDTGWNDANSNTGGDVSVSTGDANTSVLLSTMANANSATVGGGSGTGGTLSAWITGNGADSDNRINLDLNNDVLLSQINTADVLNEVDVDSDTGHNDANSNTGGDVSIETGDADTTVVVDNMVNFNSADADACGCIGSLNAKISGNGEGSDNRIRYMADSTLLLTQANVANLDNDVDVDGDTGHNDTNSNTGRVGAESDPSITTGDADSDVAVSNSGNVNLFGEGGLDLDELLEGFEFDFDLSWLAGLFLSFHS